MRAAIFDTKIEKIVDLGKDLKHFELAFKPEDKFEFEDGQFVNVIIEDETQEGKVIKRPYSIASSSLWKDRLDLSLKKVEGGFATEHFWQMKEGDTLKIQGPLGRFVVKEPLPKKIVFVSTGTGIAPFRAMAHTLLNKDAESEIINIFGNRYEGEILYKDEFEELEKAHPNFKNVFTVSRPQNWKGEHEYVQHMLKKYVPSSEDTHLYICGLTVMILAVEKAAHEIGFTKEQIHYEKYD